MTTLRLASLLFVVATTTFTLPAVAQESEPSSASKSKRVRVATPDLDARLRSILSVKGVSGSRVGIYAVDAESGAIVASNRADEAFNPASNQKLLTAAVALEVFGPGKRFQTHLEGRRKGDTIVGGLHVIGGGDPALHFEHLVDWAIELRRKGVTAVEGGIIVDEGDFGSGLPPAFDQKNEDAAYRPAIGAFSVHFNGVAVVVDGGESGGPAIVRLEPPNDYVRVENRAKTVRGTTRRVRVGARSEGDRTVVTVGGAIGDRANTVVSRKRIEAPGLFAGAALVEALEAVGITVEGDVVLGDAPDQLPRLHTHDSDSVAHLVFLMNKFSNNFMAEMLFRHLGAREGAYTEEASRATYRDVLARLGVPVDGLAVKNGSGLYLGNEVSPQQIAELLLAMRSHRYAPEFMASLPIAGVDGTLWKRLEDGKTGEHLRGKTGTLNEVTALAGYLPTESGRQLAYVILFNDTPVYAWRLRSAQDDIARALAGMRH